MAFAVTGGDTTVKMPFFIKNKKGSKGKSSSEKKTGRGGKRKLAGRPAASKKKKFGSEDDEIPSDSDIDSDEEQQRKEEPSSEEEEEETAQEKRLRLAKQYLAQLEAEEAEKKEDAEQDEDLIADRLRQDVLEQGGRLHKSVASELTEPSADSLQLLRGHQLAVTCLVICPKDQHIYTGSKDCSLIKWHIASGKRVKTIPGGRKGTEDRHKGHTAHILALAISTDARFLASGDRNKLIHIWNPDDLQLLHTFTGHRDAVSGLAFRKNSHQLFSASHDRSVKIWNLDEMAYVETLFGHQDVITGIDCLARERAVTSGGRDGTIRVWKVIEESQLVFQAHRCCVDCVALVNEETFFSGADDNSVCLWRVMKKKPVVTVHNAHSPGPEAPPIQQTENWVTAVAALQNTDVVASGSKDGCVRLWRCGEDFRSLMPLFSVPVKGFVNSLQFSSDGRMLVAGVGQEHRLGRWWRIKEARNGVVIIPLPRGGDQRKHL